MWTKKGAVEGLRWTLGLVVLLEACRFVFAASQRHAFSGSGLPGWIRPVLDGGEIAAAVLFLLAQRNEQIREVAHDRS